MFTIQRNGLVLSSEGELEYAQGSANTRILLVEDDSYSEYVSTIHCSYLSLKENSIILERVGQTSVFLIPAKVFNQSGPVRFSVALTNSSIEPSETIQTPSIMFEVTKSPSGKVILPSTRDWQSYVREYLDAQVPSMVTSEVATDIEPYLTIIQEDVNEANSAASNAQTSAEEASQAASIVSSITPRVEKLEDDISQLINDNLLINPDGAINQRGLSEYIYPLGGQQYGYTYDMWVSLRTIVSKIDYGFLLTANSLTEVCTFRQWFENLELGRTYTFSCRINDVYKEITTIHTDISEDATIYEDDDVRITFYHYIDTKRSTITIYPKVGETRKITHMKLEQGTIATPYTPPDTALELVKCKQYYEEISEYLTSDIVFGAWLSSMRFTVEKKTIPTVTLGEAGYIHGGNNVPITAVQITTKGIDLFKPETDPIADKFIKGALYSVYANISCEIF